LNRQAADQSQADDCAGHQDRDLPPAAAATSVVHFGGLATAQRKLGEVLAERIAAVPAGGEIDWATYYFGDEALAEALIAAHERGVRVRLTVDAHPRVPAVNRAVLQRLGLGLDTGLRSIRYPGIWLGPDRIWKPNLHVKIFCFSHPVPTALIGSYNPIGHSAAARELGDHERGRNVLIEFHERPLYTGLVAHTRHLHGARLGLWSRYAEAAQRVVRGTQTEIYFWPQRGPNPLDRLLATCGAGMRIRIAASHIKGPGAITPLRRLKQRGARVEVMASSSRRRVAVSSVRALLRAGAEVCRMTDAPDLPMHMKFVLADGPQGAWVACGSYNWTFRSRWMNDEVLAISREPEVWRAFDMCWQQLTAQ
jgi:phosphatidylserine/phosphatidylglycerophosphate/cardiolipin synthase-like enzyme